MSVFFSPHSFGFIEFLKVIRYVHCKSVDISSLHCTKIKSNFFFHSRFDSFLAELNCFEREKNHTGKERFFFLFVFAEI